MKAFIARLSALGSHWNSVEGRIKDYEQFAGGANAAAINELRYAGRRIVDSIVLIASDASTEDLGKEFTVAETYVINADHDVTDGVCFIVLRHVDSVIKKHGRDKIAQHYPEFWNVYPIVLKTQKIVRGSREDRINRKADYLKLAEEYLPQLRDLYTALIQIQALHVPDESDKIRQLQTRVAIVTGITIIGAISSTLALFLAWAAWAYPTSYWQIFWRIF